MGQSFLEKRRNAKALQQIQEIEGREGRPFSTFAAKGTQKFEWSNAATIVLGVFVVMFVVAAMLGYLILPGGLVLFAGYEAMKPRRTVSLSPETVTVWEHSFWSSKIAGVVTVQHRSQLQVNHDVVFVYGAKPIKVSSSEREGLARTNAELGLAFVEPALAPPPPLTPNQPVA